jgi:hypothetical protein
MLPALPDEVLPGKTLDQALTAIATRYGQRTAKLVALEFEYRPEATP